MIIANISGKRGDKSDGRSWVRMVGWGWGRRGGERKKPSRHGRGFIQMEDISEEGDGRAKARVMDGWID